MANLSESRSLCNICNKIPSIFYCRGCQKDFCSSHSKEHRQELSKQLDSIILQHDQLKQKLSECIKKPSNHPLMKEIDQWEIESINKIREAANDARKQLSQVSNDHTVKITNELKVLTQQLTTSRCEDSFIEFDLKDWMEKIEKLTNELNKPSSIDIRREQGDPTFIQKITVNRTEHDFFDQSIGNIKIDENGQIIRNESDGYSTVRSHCNYSLGQHKYRLKIEQLHSCNWMLFGIVSKNIPLQKESYTTPTNFGWIANGVLLNANFQQAYNGYKSDIQQNDTIELFLDCDRRTIRLTNERTHYKHELTVDVNQCPFPWQVHIGLLFQNDRVRYLPS